MLLATCSRLLTGAATASVLLAAAALAAALAGRPLPLPDGAGLHLLLLAYTTGVGALVARYTATNLRGQRRLPRFGLLLTGAVAALALMVASDLLVLSAIGATTSGWAVSALVAHREHPAAARAARTVRRYLGIGDLALWTAVVAHLLDGPPAVVATGLVLACVARCALVPLHRWLPETAEAPSPVSALLHGGVVNGGLMLLLVHGDLVAASPAALALLGAAGGASVLLGLAHLRLRPDVKGRLASSTTAQMGLGALALALGLPQVALAHLLGHGLWKGWLFLRAGGSVGRAAQPAPRPLGAPGVTRAPVLVAASAGGLAVLAAGLLLGAVLALPGGLALPAGLAAVLAGTAVLEATRLERAGRRTRTLLALGGVLVAGGYVVVVALLDTATHGWLADAAWRPAPVEWSLAVVGLVGAAGAVLARWQPHTTGLAAVLVGGGLLPPGTRLPGDVRGLVLGPTSSAAPHGEPHADGAPDDLVALCRVAASTVGTAWPLHSLVAANPLADLERFPVEAAAEMVSRVHGRDPRPSLALFLDLHARGVVGRTALERALAEQAGSASAERGLVPRDLETFLAVSRDGARVQAATGTPLRRRACDLVPTPRRGRPAAEVLDLHAASWTARAWGAAGGGAAARDPWTLWRSAAAHPAYDLVTGWRGASALARRLPASPHGAVRLLWPALHGRVGVDLVTYSASLLAAAPGWVGHAKWRAARGGDADALVQLLALRMALDLLVAHGADPDPAPAEPLPSDPTGTAPATAAVAVWQRALDLAARDGLVGALARAVPPHAHEAPARPAVDSVWCIDVRSERVRRHAEAAPSHRTHGFAGFFGAAVRHVDLEGAQAELCPGLLRPAADVHQVEEPLARGAALHRWVTRVGRHPAAAFGYAELNGLPALAAALGATLVPARWRRLSGLVTATGPVPPPTTALPHDVAVTAARGLLNTTGLGRSAAPVVVLVGHGSSTENNAFAAAYDCGACGGHHGALNARLVAEALADPLVRAALAAEGRALPADTVVVAALHDTTTDQVHWVGGPRPQDDPRVADALDALSSAAALAAEERRSLLPGPTGRPLVDRAADWAEPMPEWGLAGNLALVVGPRDLTRHLDLGGTAFLHDYDSEADPDGTVLSAVLAGPVTVTQWINAQYHASTSAPDLLGSGDKTVHNVVGGTGVLGGAHGDLRTGLPWQAVADHDPGARASDTSVLRHLPARHLVVLAAPRDRVTAAVAADRGLRDTVRHGWLQLLVVEPGDDAHHTLHELDRDLGWRPVRAVGHGTGAVRPRLP